MLDLKFDSQRFSDIPTSNLLPSVTVLSLISFPRKKSYPTCPQCKLILKTESDLKCHLEESQWAEYQKAKFGDSFHCEERCLFFQSEKGYKQHIGKVHITKYKYSKCPECKRKFRNKYAVKFHLKQVHQKTTRENCPDCGKVFYNKYLIPNHLEKCKGRLENENR